jgi:MFS family permease
MSKSIQIYCLFTATYFLSYFYRSANAVIAPDLSAELNLGPAELGWVTSLFYLTFAAMQLPLGTALDRFGARWVTPSLLFVGAAGSLLFASASTLGELSLGRALIGVGMAGVLMGAMQMLARWFPPQRFATMTGWLMGIGSCGALLAATPMAWLNATFGWRGVFFGGAIAVLLMAVLILLLARNAPPGYSLQPHAGGVLGSLRTVWANPLFWRIAPMNFTMTGTNLSLQGLWAGPFMYEVLQMSGVQVGNVLLGMGVGVTAGFATSGMLADRVGARPLATTTSLLMIVGLLAMALAPNVWLVTLMLPLVGYCGASVIVMFAEVRRVMPDGVTGTAVTAVNLFGIGGSFVLQWCLGLVIETFPVGADGRYPPQAYATALGVLAVLVAAALFWYHKGRRYDHAAQA